MTEKTELENRLNDIKKDYTDVDSDDLDNLIYLLEEGNYELLSMAKEEYASLSSQIELKTKELSHIIEKIDTQEVYKKTYMNELQLQEKIKTEEAELNLEKDKYLAIAKRILEPAEYSELKSNILKLRDLGRDIRDYNIQREDVER